jgi:DNA-binding transcriptional ArsR family regulator
MEISPLFKALADETRFRLFRALLTHDWCVGALAHYLKISEAAVSQHLKQLREAGLVKGEKRGYWTHYLVEKEKLKELAGALQELTLLPPSAEGFCVANREAKIARRKEEFQMCACKCQHPEKLKGKAEECSPQQIQKCHGNKKPHPCASKPKKK